MDFRVIVAEFVALAITLFETVGVWGARGLVGVCSLSWLSKYESRVTFGLLSCNKCWNLASDCLLTDLLWRFRLRLVDGVADPLE
jgi:hypothetical protein